MRVCYCHCQERGKETIIIRKADVLKYDAITAQLKPK